MVKKPLTKLQLLYQAFDPAFDRQRMTIPAEYLAKAAPPASVDTAALEVLKSGLEKLLGERSELAKRIEALQDTRPAAQIYMPRDRK